MPYPVIKKYLFGVNDFQSVVLYSELSVDSVSTG